MAVTGTGVGPARAGALVRERCKACSKIVYIKERLALVCVACDSATRHADVGNQLHEGL